MTCTFRIHVETTSATSWTNLAVSPATTYSYAVRALDSAGNLGGASAADGVRDVSACGAGLDLVRGDRMDRVARDCELVRRIVVGR